MTTLKLTRNEANRMVCEKVLGWTTHDHKGVAFWLVPDQPWNAVWHGRGIKAFGCPDFIGNPAESWRLMVWMTGTVAFYPSAVGPLGGKWGALVWQKGHRVAKDGGLHDNPSIALVLAALASVGVHAEIKE